MRRIMIAALLLGAAGGCSAVKDGQAAQTAVARFHAMLDAGQFDALYDGSAPEMKAITPKPRFVDLLSAVHRKLGTVRSATQQGWNVNYGTGGGTVTLTYQTIFSGGSATEQFVYRAGDAPALIGYNINSSDLIVK
jgi:hypothetical protein